MGYATLLLSVAAVCFVIGAVDAGASGGACPLPSKVYSCSPKCIQSYECTHGKVCCPNSCNAKSCAEPAAYGGGGSGDKHSHTSGSGIYCGNVKCNSYEVCKTDPATKRQKCGRA